MDRIAVNSATIASYGYDVGTMILEIEFTNGHLYQYFDVPEVLYRQLLAAPSAGQFFNTSIKGVYRYARL